MHKGQQRVRYLDGLRGVAILLVLAWHYLGPIYAEHLPYGTDYAWLPIVRHGFAGVQLFFLISGFVIFMTLERCSGFLDFMLRRWLRLFPAMLIGSALIFACAQWMAGQMPGGRAYLRDLVPGLTLINPFYFHQLLDLPVRSLDGAFWSLYVEAAFYVVIGLLFFRFGWQRSVAGLLILFAAVLIAPPLVARAGLRALVPALRLFHSAGFGYFGWFASGALFLKAQTSGDKGLFRLAIVVGFVAATTTALPGGLEGAARVALFASVLLFAAVQRFAFLQRVLETPVLLFFGFISYPLYLVHSAVGVGLIALLARSAGLPALLPPVLVTGAMLGLAWIMAAWLEPMTARLLKPVADAARRALGVRATSIAARPPGAPA